MAGGHNGDLDVTVGGWDGGNGNGEGNGEGR